MKIITIALLFTTLVFSQTEIKKSSIDSGGAIASNGNIEILYTIGEVNVKEQTTANIYISEGFISKNTLESLAINNFTDLQKISLYPNPTVDFINISFKESINTNIQLLDMNGKKVLSVDNNLNKITINLKNFENGLYLLVVKDVENKQFKTFKIIKK